MAAFRLRNLSVKKLFAVSAVGMALCMAAVTGLYFYLFASMVEDHAQLSFESLADAVEGRLRESIAGIDESTKRFAYTTDVQTVTFFVDPADYFRAASPTEDVVSFILGGNPNIKALYIQERDGRSFTSDVSQKHLFQYALQQQELGEGLAFREAYFDVLYPPDSGEPVVLYFCPVYNIRQGGERSREGAAVCVAMCDIGHLVDWLAIDNSSRSAMAMVYGDRVVTSNRALSDSEALAMCGVSGERGSVRIDRRLYLSNAVEIPQLGWRFVYILPQDDLLEGILPVRNISFFLLLGAIALLFVVMIRIISLISQPIQQMVGDMRGVRRQELTRVRDVPVSELQELAAGINRTLASMEEAHQKEQRNQQELYQAAVEQNRAQLRAYRSQINPHFLFNTLECMRSMARHYDSGPLEGMIRSLSSMFRYSLHSDLVVTLGDEVAHVRSYVDIMEQRRGEGCQLRVIADPAALGYPMPAMCLQPIVENAFVHGFRDKKGPCIVQIQGEVAQADGRFWLNLLVCDNGAGIPPPRLEQVRRQLAAESGMDSEDSIGLHNIAKRVRLIFGEESGFAIRSRQGHYTRVEIRLPADPLRDIGNHTWADPAR